MPSHIRAADGSLIDDLLTPVCSGPCFDELADTDTSIIAGFGLLRQARSAGLSIQGTAVFGEAMPAEWLQ